MKEKIRIWIWNFLGIKYYKYLKHKKHVHLKDANWVLIGNRTYDNGAYVWRWSKNSKLEIGNYCSIANDVHFICDSGFHTESEVTSFPLFHEVLKKDDFISINGIEFLVKDIKEKLNPKKQNIFVGHDVWIGANVTVLPGVSIGNGVIVLAGAVISENLPDYTIVGGVPAKIIRKRHSDEVIKKMNTIKWWNWDDITLKDRINDFYIPIEEFIEKYS